MRTLTTLLLPLLLWLGGCESTYYAAMEKVGLEKRDILVDRVEDARDAQEDAQEQFTTALERYSALVDFDGGELQDVYENLNDEYEASEAAVPTRWPHGLLRRPDSNNIIAPPRGSAISSHTGRVIGASVLSLLRASAHQGFLFFARALIRLSLLRASAHQCFSRFAASTLAERRDRKMVMMMASPITTSQAATTIVKNATTCPSS